MTVLRIAVSLIPSIAILWAATALWIDGPESPVLAGTLAGGLVLIAGVAAGAGPPLVVGRRRRLCALRDRTDLVADPRAESRA